FEREVIVSLRAKARRPEVREQGVDEDLLAEDVVLAGVGRVLVREVQDAGRPLRNEIDRAVDGREQLGRCAAGALRLGRAVAERATRGCWGRRYRRSGGAGRRSRSRGRTAAPATKRQGDRQDAGCATQDLGEYSARHAIPRTRIYAPAAIAATGKMLAHGHPLWEAGRGARLR